MSKETSFERRIIDYKPGGAVWLKQEVERITKKYEYLEDIKDLQGWMWEFIRRSKRYNTLFKFIELTWPTKLVDTVRWWAMEFVDSEHILDTPECADIIQWLKNEPSWLKEDKSKIRFRSPFFLTSRFCNIARTSILYKADTLLNPDHFHIAEKVKVVGAEHKTTGEYIYAGIPRPTVPYPEFLEMYKPNIVGLSYVRYDGYSYLMGLFLASTNPTIDYLESLSSKQEKREHLAGIFQNILFNLSPTIPEETIFLGVSRNVRTKEELLQQLEHILDKLVRPSKKREPKNDVWKYYLVAYDLKENDGYAKYRLISEVMTMAYPDIRRMDLKIGENYYKAGKEMIEGGYRKYLTESTITQEGILKKFLKE